MRIGLLNFHYAYNYGAVLQSTALMKQLQKMGHEVDIINYRPYYQMQYYVPYPNPLRAFSIAWRKTRGENIHNRVMFSGKWLVRTILNYRQANDRRVLQKLFEPYVRKKFNETHLYKNLRELRKAAPEGYDAYICGSDQLWNPDVTWGIDAAYYLNFGTVERKVAYAVSPCGLDCEKHAEEIKVAAEELSSISLRESEKHDELATILGREDIVICPDPTLLLDAEDYGEFEEQIDELPESYILFYGFLDKENNQKLIELAKRASEKYNLPIVDISIDTFHWENVEVIRRRVTPGQFLTYIKEAHYIITNSFHGTVFSMIYKKEFYTICKTGTASRMEELLRKMGLLERIANNVELKFDNVNYSAVQGRIDSIRKNGIDYLQEALK